MKKVMLVEDEKKIRKGIKTLLEDVITGYKVLWEAPNGKKALEIMAIDIPDIIIVDIRMPEMNGMEFIKHVRNQSDDRPIIVISGYDEFGYVREALRYGVTDYLLKPINRKELANVLEKLKAKNSEKKGEADDHQPYNIKRIKNVIKKNLGQDISLQFLSDTLNLHPNYISQSFKQSTNINLSDYIAIQRIEKAKELLKSTHLKVYDVANLVGFANAKHFTSVFKKHTGQTPQNFRK